MSKLFGKAQVSVDGTQLLVDQDGKLDLGGVNRNTVKGTDVYGYAEEAMEATIDISVFVDAKTDVHALNNLTDATAMFKADTGQTWVLAHAWTSKPISLSAASNGGKATLSIAAPKAVRI